VLLTLDISLIAPVLPTSSRELFDRLDLAMAAVSTVRLSKLLSDAAAETQRLPRLPVEPLVIALRPEASPRTNAGVFSLGVRVCAPQAPLAADVVFKPLSRVAVPGREAAWELGLAASYPVSDPEDLAVAIDCVARHTQPNVRFVSGGLCLSELEPRVSLDVSNRCVFIKATVPEFARSSECTVVLSAIVLGEGTNPILLPPLPVRAGIHAPLVLPDATHKSVFTPVVSADGIIHAPHCARQRIGIYDSDGTLLRSLDRAANGLPPNVATLAIYDDGCSPGLLIAGGDVGSKDRNVIAFDLVTFTKMWAAPVQFNHCLGMAALPEHGIVVASSFYEGTVRALSAADGSVLSALDLRSPVFVASYPSTASIYVDSADKVHRLQWDTSSRSLSLTPSVLLVPHAQRVSWRPLAVMPPSESTRGKIFLVVAVYNNPELSIFELPSERLACTHTLEGMQVVGLAADPCGTALVVCDAFSKAVHALPWPLPGMAM
jgi:hypothetical protein